jgi:hypothetical protein
MPYSKVGARYDADSRDWAFERRVTRLIAETDFLDLETPEDMPPDVYKKMLYDFEQNNIRNTERNREMFLETLQLNQELQEFGVTPEKVAPTKDGRGYVRLSFGDMFKLLDLIPEEGE